ncbi:PQQ-binding-like beta-propeller repeat protein [Microbacterium sp. K24]|uniref:outer membrane protein assembly factor BamB family protein n=1 Tax=Microbacterium sp. K24 TaxID=2305446 RepID=UPI00109D72E0|nr:PQQ-binding-like beta-propeller repeat protein [Microbacterium sp. K24]
MTGGGKGFTMRRLVVLLVIAATLALSACSADPGWDEELTPAWTRSVSAVSHPIVLDDVVVAYVTGRDRGAPYREFLTAWNLDDGKVLWSLEAMPGNGHAGVEHSVAALQVQDDWYVAFLAPLPEDQSGELVSEFRVVAAATGDFADDALEARTLAAQRPRTCDSGDAFCITGILESSSAKHDETFSYVPGDSEFAVEAAEGAPDVDGAAYLGAGVALTDDDWVRYGADGELRWTRSFAGIFGPDTASYAGFSWNEPEDEEARLIGAGRGWHPFGDPGAHTEPLTDGRVVGLDRESGRTIWAVDGARQCTGGPLVHDGIAILCVFRSGTVTSDWTGEYATNFRYDGVDLDLVGVDIVSGEKRWTVALRGDAAAAADPWDERPDLISGERLVVSIDGLAHTVEPQTGTTARIGSEAVLLCSAPKRDVELDYGGAVADYPAAEGMRFCSPTGEVVSDGSMSVGTMDLLGVDLDEPLALLVNGSISVYLPQE